MKEGTEMSLIVNTRQNPGSVAVVSKRRNPQVWYERKETGKVDSWMLEAGITVSVITSTGHAGELKGSAQNLL